MTKFKNVLALALLSINSYAVQLEDNSTVSCSDKERCYQEAWCEIHNGVAEYRLDDGTRVDCLTNTHAVEVDWVGKFYEAIGQALWYSLKTGKKPGILLILNKSDYEEKIQKLLQINDFYKLGIDIWFIKKLSRQPGNYYKRL